MYCFFKDFAQPLVTLLGAAAVGFFAFCQWRTARAQARTSLDQLRHNLFERRYKIYETTRHMLRTMLSDTRRPGFSAFDIAQYLVVLDEAIFFYPPSLCDWLTKVRADCQRLLEEHAGKSDGTGNPRLYAAAEQTLLSYWQEMPVRFRDYLGFEQLTKDGVML